MQDARYRSHAHRRHSIKKIGRTDRKRLADAYCSCHTKCRALASWYKAHWSLHCIQVGTIFSAQSSQNNASPWAKKACTFAISTDTTANASLLRDGRLRFCPLVGVFHMIDVFLSSCVTRKVIGAIHTGLIL